MEKASSRQVLWRSTGGLKRHWVGTTVTWALTPGEEGTTVHFNHDGWASDEGPFAMSAYTRGQLMITLKERGEKGKAVPLFRKAAKRSRRA